MTNDRRPTRLPGWQEWSIYIGLGLLFATGVGWLLLDWFVRVPGEFGPERHPAQHWSMVAHGILAYCFLAIAGSLIPIHIRLGWILGRQRASGSAMAGTLILLSITALGLYYAADDVARNWISIAHWTLGLLVLLAIAVHVIPARG